MGSGVSLSIWTPGPVDPTFPGEKRRDEWDSYYHLVREYTGLGEGLVPSTGTLVELLLS